MWSGNLWSCLKEVKTPVVFDGDCRMALEPMQCVWASSSGDWGHLIVSLKLWWEPGVSSRVTVGMFFNHSCFLRDVRTPV